MRVPVETVSKDTLEEFVKTPDTIQGIGSLGLVELVEIDAFDDIEDDWDFGISPLESYEINEIYHEYVRDLAHEAMVHIEASGITPDQQIVLVNSPYATEEIQIYWLCNQLNKSPSSAKRPFLIKEDEDMLPLVYRADYAFGKVHNWSAEPEEVEDLSDAKANLSAIKEYINRNYMGI